MDVKLFTTELAERFAKYPLYSQDGKGLEAICIAIFEIGNIRWYILEGNIEDDDVIMFGIVTGMFEDEYGYISLKELSEIRTNCNGRLPFEIQVRERTDFKPCKISELQDDEVKDFVTRIQNTSNSN